MKTIEFSSEIWQIESALNGLGSLFYTRKEMPFNEDEMFGIGELLKIIGNQLGDIRKKIS